MTSSISASFAQTTAKQITDPTSKKVISKGKNQKRVLFSDLHDPNKQYALAIKDQISANKPKLGLIEKRYYAVLKVKQGDNEVYVKVNRQSLAKRLGIPAKSFKDQIDVTNTVQQQVEKLKPIELPEDIVKDWQIDSSEEDEKAKRSAKDNFELGINTNDPRLELICLSEAAKKMTPQSQENSPSVKAAKLLGIHFKKTHPEKAEEYLRRAAQQGNADAKAQLGEILITRAKKEENPVLYREAIAWLKKAEDQSDALDLLEREWKEMNALKKEFNAMTYRGKFSESEIKEIKFHIDWTKAQLD